MTTVSPRLLQTTHSWGARKLSESGERDEELCSIVWGICQEESSGMPGAPRRLAAPGMLAALGPEGWVDDGLVLDLGCISEGVVLPKELSSPYCDGCEQTDTLDGGACP